MQAESAEAALARLSKAAANHQFFDLVLIDLHMPGANGFELARMIKAENELNRSRLILMSPFTKQGHNSAALDAGFSAYLTKPVRQSQLFDCITAVMSDSFEDKSTVAKHPLALITQISLDAAKAKSKRVVLIVEDNIVNQEVAKRQVQKLGYSTEVAANGREALEAVRQHEYAVVLMDCQMPVMDGFDATSAIRAMEYTRRRTPIIAMTANAMQGEREKCLEAGMDGYISKPVNQDELERILNEWESRGEPVHHLAVVQAVIFDSNSSASSTDSVQIRLRELESDFDRELVMNLIEMFIPDTNERLCAMHSCINLEDRKQLAREAHGLKGSSSNLGAKHFAQKCADLEAEASSLSFDEAVRRVNELEACWIELQPVFLAKQIPVMAH
jgi:CheY-like chemotaxis protein